MSFPDSTWAETCTCPEALAANAAVTAKSRIMRFEGFIFFSITNHNKISSFTTSLCRLFATGLFVESAGFFAGAVHCPEFAVPSYQELPSVAVFVLFAVVFVVTLKELGLADSDLSLRTRVEEVFLPSEKEGAQIIAGDPTSVAEEIIQILKEKGVSV